MIMEVPVGKVQLRDLMKVWYAMSKHEVYRSLRCRDQIGASKRDFLQGL